MINKDGTQRTLISYSGMMPANRRNRPRGSFRREIEKYTFLFIYKRASVKVKAKAIELKTE
jgi:hypothetical protein